jgi:nitroimidazol reductase NimA-like FMN-containing flavoprotein (pyridoxamine 5'-phosphate oxidase superfamily)/GNAT superfamily N-acetyltransferase
MNRPVFDHAPRMRTNRFPWPREQALALLAEADTAHFALLDDDGRPILRVVHTVLDGDALCFHASRQGAKLRGLGRTAVASVERTLAIIPSYAFDAERACPATTWYQSVQVRGTLTRVADPERKARVLQALMERLQSEGGHVPISADHELYERAIAGLEVLALPLEEVSGRAKIGQNRSDEQVRRALECLWRRGDPGVDVTIENILAARPELGVPEFLRGPAGTQLCCRPRASEVARAVELVEREYWNVTTSRETLVKAHERTPIWVGARDREARLIATARAISDGGKHAWIYDVAVEPAWRGRGVGGAVIGLLLDHPQVREARYVHLQTKDAGGFYAKLGFAPHPAGANPRWVRVSS